MSIKHAIEALDKATPGEWASAEEAPDWIGAERKGETFHVSDVRGWGTLEKEGQKGCDELSANIALIAAAPDMAAWIRKALPWIQEKSGETKELLKRIRSDEDAGLWEKVIPNLEEDVSTLAALIAEATDE